MTLLINPHPIQVFIDDMSPPTWVCTHKARVIWLANRPWRLLADAAKPDQPDYIRIRQRLLQDAHRLYRAYLADMPTDRHRTVSLYEQETLRMEAIR